MALQDFIVHEVGDQLFRKLTQPASGGKVGDACLVGRRPGYLLTDQDANGFATVKFCGSFRVAAHGVTGAGNSAIAAGDDLYYDAGAGAGNPFINKDNTNGVFFGVAASAVGSNVKGTVVVDLV